MKEIYLDNSATTKPLPEVVEAVTQVLTDNYGNPSSLHNKGLAAEKILKEARQVLASKLGVTAREIFFTSGGTESNNLAIKGIAYQYKKRGRHLITTPVEHPSVLNTFKALEKEGFELTLLPTDKYGLVSPEDLQKAIRQDTILVSIIYVHNELGGINPVQELGRVIKEHNPRTFLHVDAVQALGKVSLQPARWKIDLLTLSAHKIHGPKGVGALYVKKGTLLHPLFHGGGQEQGLRSGTENVPGIAGLIPALQKLPDLSQTERAEDLDRLRQYFLEQLAENLPQAIVNSPAQGAPHILNISFPGVKAEVLIHSLEAEGIYLSTGSACHSRLQGKNHVLKAIKLSPELIDSTVRVSFSHFNQLEEIDYAIKKIKEKIALYF